MDYMQPRSTKTASPVKLVHDKTLEKLFSSGEVLSFVDTGEVVSFATDDHFPESLSGLTSIAGGTDISYQVLKTVIPAILSYFEHDNFGNFEVRKSSPFHPAFHGTMSNALNRITRRLLVKSPQAIVQELEAKMYAELTEEVALKPTKKLWPGWFEPIHSITSVEVGQIHFGRISNFQSRSGFGIAVLFHVTGSNIFEVDILCYPHFVFFRRVIISLHLSSLVETPIVQPSSPTVLPESYGNGHRSLRPDFMEEKNTPASSAFGGQAIQAYSAASSSNESSYYQSLSDKRLNHQSLARHPSQLPYHIRKLMQGHMDIQSNIDDQGTLRLGEKYHIHKLTYATMETKMFYGCATNHCTFPSFNIYFMALNFAEFDLMFETRKTIQDRIDIVAPLLLTKYVDSVYQYNHLWIVWRTGLPVDGVQMPLGGISMREAVVNFNRFFEAGSAEEMADDIATAKSSNRRENDQDTKATVQDRDRNPSRKGESQRLRRQQKRKQKRDSKPVVASSAEDTATTPNDGEAESLSVATSKANNPRESSTR